MGQTGASALATESASEYLILERRRGTASVASNDLDPTPGRSKRHVVAGKGLALAALELLFVVTMVRNNQRFDE